ncbi:MAG: hypothetical protein AMS18_07875 [Gemmatimonas sp. SG8_17]|nr:MAG: hypothetical protein AMS18_07875 [Gemmatimonas sp. SG8_17]
MKGKVPPRIYCIPATDAPIVAVFRRGPTNWSHMGRWDLGQRRYDQGAWLGGRIFPRRSDLSPDGRLLCYFAHKPSATWGHGEAYVALSKLPWLTALHVFGTCGTWTRGYYFTEDDHYDGPKHLKPPIPYGLQSIPVGQFANERRRGWEEAPDSPQRDPGDFWDERRNARMQKRQPGGDRVLCVKSLGWAGDEFGVDQAVDGLRVRYWLEADGELELLDDLQWADWDREGHLLVATRGGKLQVRNLAGDDSEILFDEDLSLLEPSPGPAPAWAQRW